MQVTKGRGGRRVVHTSTGTNKSATRSHPTPVSRGSASGRAIRHAVSHATTISSSGRVTGAPPSHALAHYAAAARAQAKRQRKSPQAQARRAIKRQVLGKLRQKAKQAVSPLDRLNRGFKPDETVSAHDAALLAESQGLPGKTYAQIAKGESGLRPGVPNPDDGYPSLWQMTPSVQSGATRAKWNKIAKKFPGGPTNPLVAAKQAKVIAGGGTGVSNYYGTGFVTNPNAHLKGGPAKARKELAGKPIPKAIKKKAAKIVGPSKVKKVVQHAQKRELRALGKGQAPSVHKKGGPWGGSQRAVLRMIPKSERAEGRGDKRTPAENASVGGATDSDHLTSNKLAYAADIPVNAQVYATLRKRLGLAPATTGEDTVVKGGYRYQLIYGSQYGHGDHIHLGAEWVGSGTPPGYAGGPIGSSSLGAISSGAATTSAGSSGTGAAPSSRASVAPRRRKRKNKAAARIEAEVKRSIYSTPSSTTAPTFKRSSTPDYVPSRSAPLGL